MKKTWRVIHLEQFNVDFDPIYKNTAYKNTIENGYYFLQIWDPNITITGPHRYKITYLINNAIVPFIDGEANLANNNGGGDRREELYWNIIGNERDTRINKVSFSLQLPHEIPLTEDQIFFVYGPLGAKLTDNIDIQIVSATQIEGSLSQKLSSWEGASIGIMFPLGFFNFPEGYEKYFTSSFQNQQQPNWRAHLDLSDLFSAFMLFVLKIFGILIRIAIIFLFGKIFTSKTDKPARKSNKTITPYYTPPKNIETLYAFWFRYYAKNPRMFTAIIYYWATKGRITIEKLDPVSTFFWSASYSFTKIVTKPEGETELEQQLFSDFFDTSNELSLMPEYSEIIYDRLTLMTSSLSKGFNKFSQEANLIASSRSIFSSDRLTAQWAQLFEELRGFKHYLEKVERPVIEQFLKDDPEYLDKILPRAILFGVETKLFKKIEDLMQKNAEKQHIDDNTLLTASMLSGITTAFSSYSSIWSSSNSRRWSSFSSWGGWSSFLSWWSGWGGSSWWGGWWGGGSSW